MCDRGEHRKIATAMPFEAFTVRGLDTIEMLIFVRPKEAWTNCIFYFEARKGGTGLAEVGSGSGLTVGDG